jgi:hypothetical protein
MMQNELIMKAVFLKDEGLIQELINHFEGTFEKEELRFFAENQAYEIKQGSVPSTPEFKAYLESNNYFGLLDKNTKLTPGDLPISLAEDEQIDAMGSPSEEPNESLKETLSQLRHERYLSEDESQPQKPLSLTPDQEEYVRKWEDQIAEMINKNRETYEAEWNQIQADNDYMKPLVRAMVLENYAEN